LQPQGVVSFIQKFGVNRNRVFRADALFIRTENTVGARGAQWLLLDDA
jgi:hypothetical protein